jgi:16S rRNA (cytosine967-C5)-methyltransferase
MRGDAQYQAVIEILDTLRREPISPDRMLYRYFKQRRYIGSHDRKHITALVYTQLRDRLFLQTQLAAVGLQEPYTARLLVLAQVSRTLDTVEIMQTIFTGKLYGPAPLSPQEKDILQQLKHIQHTSSLCSLKDTQTWPVFMGNQIHPELWDALEGPAPVDLRVNTLRTTREEVLSILQNVHFDPQPTPLSPVGIRLQKRVHVNRLAIYKKGWFEIQDEGAQLLSYLCAVTPGERVLDLCAGAGGKTLHLAALMNNTGCIYASDAAPDRLMRCQYRVQRAGIKNVHIISPEQIERFCPYDCVLVDAPCSGSGTWRRRPDLKNQLTEASLKELLMTQATLLNQAATYVKPGGGRLVYATCSILEQENDAQIHHFLQVHPEFTLLPADHWSFEPLKRFACGNYLKLDPLTSQTDGFFGAVLIKR